VVGKFSKQKKYKMRVKHTQGK